MTLQLGFEKSTKLASQLDYLLPKLAKTFLTSKKVPNFEQNLLS